MKEVILCAGLLVLSLVAVCGPRGAYQADIYRKQVESMCAQEGFECPEEYETVEEEE